jgi:hypothetical protein
MKLKSFFFLLLVIVSLCFDFNEALYGTGAKVQTQSEMWEWSGYYAGPNYKLGYDVATDGDWVIAGAGGSGYNGVFFF